VPLFTLVAITALYTLAHTGGKKGALKAGVSVSVLHGAPTHAYAQRCAALQGSS
jgi:hypothetical protein